MQKIVMTGLVAGVLAASTAFAADASGLGGASVSATVDFVSGSASASDGTSDNGKTNALGLQGRYDWVVAPNVALGLGASYSSGNHQGGTYASGASAYVGNRYSIDFIPTVAVGNGWSVFGKLSSVAGQASSDDGSSTSNVQGVGYGLGVRQMLNRTTYWQAGYDMNKFNDVTFNTGTTSSLKENVFSLGVGVKF